MTKENAIKLFQDQRVRVHWDTEKEKWYFSIIDVIGVLTESQNPRKYWSVLKTRLKKEGSEVATNCSRLKLLAIDGKMRLTDEWDLRGVKKGLEYAILTNEITEAWSGFNIKEYKKFKKLKRKLVKK
jgi:hypothetical protein